VEATLNGFGIHRVGLFLRADDLSHDRYELVLRDTGALELRRVRQGIPTVLSSVHSGLLSFSRPSLLTLTATGSSPVVLKGAVNGVLKLSFSDNSAQAIGTAGQPGMVASHAGAWFDNFRVQPTGPP
jgi:hypothetical protein